MKNTSIKQLLKLLLLSSLLVLQSYAHAEVKITYYIPDVLGSPIAATDEQGKVLWRKHYKPFGEEIEQDAESKKATKNNHIGYTGHVHDRDTGLTYMRARYYDPVVGRFMAMDPAGVNPNDPRTFNRFAYANNNPYKYIDPDGRLPKYLRMAVPNSQKEKAGKTMSRITGGSLNKKQVNTITEAVLVEIGPAELFGLYMIDDKTNPLEITESDNAGIERVLDAMIKNKDNKDNKKLFQETKGKFSESKSNDSIKVADSTPKCIII